MSVLDEARWLYIAAVRVGDDLHAVDLLERRACRLVLDADAAYAYVHAFRALPDVVVPIGGQ